MSFFKTSFLHKSSKSFSRIACGIGAKNGTEKDLSLELRDLSQTCHEKKLETNGAAIGKLGSQVTLKKKWFVFVRCKLLVSGRVLYTHPKFNSSPLKNRG